MNQNQEVPGGWREKAGSLIKLFEFDDFESALAFVNAVGALAEEADHHPDIRLFAYKKVELALTTHEEGRVSEKDFALARAIERL